MNQLICGDSLNIAKQMPSNSIDSLVSDPPYGLEFMGKDWDKGLPGVRFWREFLRITKPGGFLLCFGGTRTYHRLACAIEDAGWQIRDCMMWLYGSGFPKSYNIGQALEKKITTGKCRRPDRDLGKLSRNRWSGSEEGKLFADTGGQVPYTQELAKQWQGYGTALKPAWEPIIVAMKPLDGTFAHNADAHGVAGLNINAARIHRDSDDVPGWHKSGANGSKGYQEENTFKIREMSPKEIQQRCGSQGRWPANLVLDEEAGAMLDEQTGITKPKPSRKGKRGGKGFGFFDDEKSKNANGVWPEDSGGGASRFFYCAKTSRKERNMGMEDQKNSHPTVKPLALMKYLCTLLKMPSAEQIILDPFLGSGTTGMACASLGIGFIGIEKEPEYCEIASKRISAISGKPLPVTKNVETFRTTKDSAGGKCRRPDESLPHVSEHRQNIINAASAALRRNTK